MQEGYGILMAQHSDDPLSRDDGHLVYTVAIHMLKRGPQLAVSIDAFQLFEGSMTSAALVVAQAHE